jgi:hypothetical protein
MSLSRLNRRYVARLALAGAIGGAFAVVASPAPALANNFACTIGEIAIWVGSRIHVRCDPGDAGGINYFALSVANPDSNRALSLATTAMAARLPVVIVYDPNDLSGAAFGCLTSNCRLIQAIGMERQ